MARMNIKVTKVFANFCNQAAKEAGRRFEAKVVEMSEGQYILNVANADIYSADYNYKTDKYKVLAVFYPSEFYALPQYFSTETILQAWRRSNGRTAQDLKNVIIELCEI